MAASERDMRTREDEDRVEAQRRTQGAPMQFATPPSLNNPPTRTEAQRPMGKMSRAEAGRKGGLATKQRYGEGHFSRIGHKGGKKGGESTKRRYGVEFYKQIGRKGGSA